MNKHKVLIVNSFRWPLNWNLGFPSVILLSKCPRVIIVEIVGDMLASTSLNMPFKFFKFPQSKITYRFLWVTTFISNSNFTYDIANKPTLVPKLWWQYKCTIFIQQKLGKTCFNAQEIRLLWLAIVYLHDTFGTLHEDIDVY